MIQTNARIVVLVLLVLLLSSCSPREEGRSISDEETHGQLPGSSLDIAQQELPQEQEPHTVAELLADPALLEVLQKSGWDISQELLEKQTLPVQDDEAGDLPSAYLVELSGHRYERQEGNSCGGYASAYLLRRLGENAGGEEIYASLDFKINFGIVMPQGILDHFQQRGYSMTMYQGDLAQLKYRLYQGNPVIVLVGNGFWSQHYMVLVGYDGDLLYFFDSNAADIPDKPYNNVMTQSEFEHQWNNGIPYFDHVYLVVE